MVRHAAVALACLALAHAISAPAAFCPIAGLAAYVAVAVAAAGAIVHVLRRRRLTYPLDDKYP